MKIVHLFMAFLISLRNYIFRYQQQPSPRTISTTPPDLESQPAPTTPTNPEPEPSDTDVASTPQPLEPRPPQLVQVCVVHNLHRQDVIMSFCFASAVQIALQFPQSPMPAGFVCLSLAITIAFSALSVAKLASSKFPGKAKVVEQVGDLLAASAFYLAVSIPLPPVLKGVTGAVYAASLFAIFISKFFLN